MKRKSKKMSFEDAMAALEETVRILENGELPLADSLDKFTEGIEYSKLCLEKLDAAEEQINIVLQEQKGKITPKELVLEEEQTC